VVVLEKILLGVEPKLETKYRNKTINFTSTSWYHMTARICNKKNTQINIREYSNKSNILATIRAQKSARANSHKQLAFTIRVFRQHPCCHVNSEECTVRNADDKRESHQKREIRRQLQAVKYNIKIITRRRQIYFEMFVSSTGLYCGIQQTIDFESPLP